MKTTKIMMILALLGAWVGGERKWYPAKSGVSQQTWTPKKDCWLCFSTLRWRIVRNHPGGFNRFNHNKTSMTSSLATQKFTGSCGWTFIHIGGYPDWWALAPRPWLTKKNGGNVYLQNGLIARHLIKNLGTYHWVGLKELQEALAFAISFMKVSCNFSLHGIW